ncbi:PEP-CTERM sorting domain-containing protein [uncultured Rhodoblastus sp.]|uniref:PEP-CTERM sorting domain-containing protein n=1 Tax=uncultured Rhodoblastus sp. TaxID=543037 RepID=UPI0025E5F75A|nr:PEP-CTERM sorting domain-containing protein [uncultured Rhodoblastus sp.]
MKRASLFTLAFLLLGAGQASAVSLVGVTFNSSGGASQWTNETALGTTNNLPSESGAGSGISLTTSVNGAYAPFGISVNPATIPSGNPNLGGINGNIYGENSFTAALSGLKANATYDVWVFATRQNYPTNQLVTITGAGTTSFYQIDASTKELIVNSVIGSSSKSLGYYALPIVADGSGHLTITVDNYAGSYGAAVSGLAIASVPESSTWAMMLIGFAGLGFAGYRSRKSVSSAA